MRAHFRIPDRPAATRSAAAGRRLAQVPVRWTPLVQRSAVAGADLGSLEREAEAFAEQAGRHGLSTDSMTSGPNRVVQRASPVTTPLAGEKPSPDVEKEIAARKGGGRSLSAAERAHYEPRLGADLARVRLHVDTPAAGLADALEARAFTYGQNIFFGSGQYGGTGSGSRLLAHELVHTVQQRRASPRGIVQKQEFGPAAGAPKDWKTKVSAATTSAQKAALVQQATGVTTVDVTAKTSGDAKVDKTKLVPYGSSSQQINYDEGLNSKKSVSGGRTLTRNAGYTINSSKNYVVLGPKALDGGRYFLTRRILSHEFDHIRQAKGGSKLTGNESELDAWTTSFIRDFHRSYLLKKTGTTCFIQSNPQWNPLLEYYVRKDVSATGRDNAVKRLEAYYNATIKPHAAHKIVFQYWIHRMLKTAGSKYDDLPDRLNKELALGVNAAASLSTTRQFSCSAVSGASYPKAPEVAKP